MRYLYVSTNMYWYGSSHLWCVWALAYALTPTLANVVELVGDLVFWFVLVPNPLVSCGLLLLLMLLPAVYMNFDSCEHIFLICIDSYLCPTVH